jgi:hypothetical protein
VVVAVMGILMSIIGHRRFSAPLLIDVFPESDCAQKDSNREENGGHHAHYSLPCKRALQATKQHRFKSFVLRKTRIV